MEIGDLAQPQGEKKKKWVPMSGPQHIDSGNPFVREREGFYYHLKKQTSKQCQPDQAIVLVHRTIRSDEKVLRDCPSKSGEKCELPFI